MTSIQRTDNGQRVSSPPEKSPKNEKFSSLEGRKITQSDELKSWGRTLKIMGLQLKVFGAKIRNDQKAATKTKYQIRHLQEEDRTLDLRSQFKGSFLMPSRNFMKMDFFKSEKFKETLKQEQVAVAPQNRAEFAKNMERLPVEMKGGVCLGACMDLGSKLVADASNYLTDPVTFQKQLLEEAAHFQTGVSAAAIANQFAYKLTTPSAVEQTLYLFIDRPYSEGKFNPLQKFLSELFINTYVLKPNEISQSRLGALAGDKLLEKYIGAAVETFPKPYPANFGKKLEAAFAILKTGIEQKLTPDEIKDKIKNAFPEGHQHFSPIVDNLTACIDRLKKTAPQSLNPNLQTEIRATKQARTPLTIRLDSLRQAMQTLFKSDKANKQLKVTPLQELQHQSQLQEPRLDKVAESRGLKTIPILSNTGQGDEAYLKVSLHSITNGVYEMLMNTKSGAHATLVFKKDEDVYFWDPNEGLFKCDQEDPKKLIQDRLSHYSSPGEKGDHHLRLYRLQEAK